MNPNKKQLEKAINDLLDFNTAYAITSKRLKEDEKFMGKIEPGLPFFCEATLYTLMGKDSARTLLGNFLNLIKAAGFDPYKDFKDKI